MEARETAPNGTYRYLAGSARGNRERGGSALDSQADTEADKHEASGTVESAPVVLVA